MEEFGSVGKRIPKGDARDKVTGRAMYMDDLKVPGMLYGKILFSKFPHGKILHINTSKAEKLIGVRAVLTGRDIPPIRFGFLKDNVPLKWGKVRSYRDEVAAIAAIDLDIAEEAINLIEVEYEALPGVFDPEEAMREGAPLVHEVDARGNSIESNVLQLPWKLVAGDVDKARSGSDYIAEDRLKATWVTHVCMGTMGIIAEFDLRNNLTVYANTQIPYLAQRDYSDALAAMGLKGSKARIIQPAIGGGFGSKLDTYGQDYIAILLAHKTRKPVKIQFTREEEFFATSPRQPAIINITQGCTRDGKLTFRDVSMILDNGAYASWGATTPSIRSPTSVILPDAYIRITRGARRCGDMETPRPPSASSAIWTIWLRWPELTLWR